MQLVFLILIHWIVIYLVDSTIQLLNNQGQGFLDTVTCKGSCLTATLLPLSGLPINHFFFFFFFFGWFSPLLREVFLWVLRFSPLLKNQHFQIPIRSGMHRHVSTSSCELLSDLWVNKLQFTIFYNFTNLQFLQFYNHEKSQPNFSLTMNQKRQ